MIIKNKPVLIRRILIVASFAIVSGILWNTYIFFQEFKQEERAKMEVYAEAVVEVNQNSLKDDLSNLSLKILSSNTSNPRIFVTIDKVMEAQNMNEEKIKDSLYLQKKVLQFSKENIPINISYFDESLNKQVKVGTLYYGNSTVLNKLKYYPLALLLIIVLFGAVAYFFFSASKASEQNKLWAGMAKETAHQIGTPLSSLVGWAEILKTENVDPQYVIEIEKDIDRLQTITERFSKIGSIPTLERLDIVQETKDSYDYLLTRSSKLVNFTFEAPETPIYAEINMQLYSWTIENMVKNAIDAMKGKGALKLEIIPSDTFVKILITDNGKGIPKRNFKKVFQPGFTSKKRGWGLGLSLAKRIVENYHNGKIKVLKSELGKGTTMQISLKTVV
ncbi:HAMP domain-containing histidine kinase [Kordia sp. YSTF-M3]|uniref:histidine kinase n=1 Tax=Kordia aestuariivivens TaxID=2759037 RepID=A0ABR7QAF6_9FLAO|nr:HAMP domain-containing sensor histidine kinase [Kordia aestuariivivens]MBC8755550.1 HAMP domain-containing histidine kinase [Kordia aestuariivivens]